MEDVENESGQVNSHCLSIPLILREILKCCSSTELVQLSLVNKQWNYEARSLLRTRGNIIASLGRNKTCPDLRAFASVLRGMKENTGIVPFSGMTISVGGSKCHENDNCQQSPNNDELEPVYEEILGGLTWKHFSLKHLVGWVEHASCPGFILQKKIIKKLDSVLEELSIQLEGNWPSYFKVIFIEDSYFSSLKTFRLLNGEETFAPEWSYLIHRVVSQAPNLQVLYTEKRVNLQANLLQGSSAVHVTAFPYAPFRNDVPESVAAELRMHGLDLSTFSSGSDLRRFNRITSILLQSSRSVMTSLTIDVAFFAPLMNYGICLENLRTFVLGLDPLNVEEMPHVWKIAKSFNFTHMFPKLTTVTIIIKFNSFIPDDFEEIIEQVHFNMRTPSPDRAVNIKHLKLRYLPVRVVRQRSSFNLLAQLFPSVQKLSILTSEISSIDIRDIWAELKEVDVTLRCSVQSLTNLDSVICGIFPKEVAQLREEDEEYLRRVNIVPVMPTIAYLKELRTFEVHYENRVDSYEGPIDDPTCLFSKVTPLVAFQRCPNLTVTLTTEDERLAEALGHLRPYATVAFKRRPS